MDTMNQTITRNKPFLLFVFIYFGFQLFAQIWNKHLGAPSSRNSIQNFVSALVLIALVIYFGNPQLSDSKYVYIFIGITYITILLYSYAKKGLEEMSEKDKKLGKDSSLKVLTIIIIFIYGTLAIIYLGTYMSRMGTAFGMGEPLKIFGVGVLLIGLTIAFYKLKNNKDDQDNLALALYLYPFLFLTRGLTESRFMSYIYAVFFTTVVALWGFFGVEWFTGKKDYEGVNEKVCKAYLGISDDAVITPISQDTQTKINTRNINFIYVAVGLIFVTFMLAAIFMYVSFKTVNRS